MSRPRRGYVRLMSMVNDAMVNACTGFIPTCMCTTYMQLFPAIRKDFYPQCPKFYVHAIFFCWWNKYGRNPEMETMQQPPRFFFSWVWGLEKLSNWATPIYTIVACSVHMCAFIRSLRPYWKEQNSRNVLYFVIKGFEHLTKWAFINK